MSINGINFEFFDIAMTKDLLHIKQTDSSEDALLSGTIGLKAERWVKNSISGFVDSFPLSQEYQESAISAACSFAASRYKRHNSLLDAAKAFMDDAKEEINSLIKALKAIPTARSKIVAVSKDYDTEDDILFSQRLIR